MGPRRRVAVERKRPWPDRPGDGVRPSGDGRLVHLLPGEDDEVRPVHRGDVADPVHRPHREDHTLMPARRQKTFKARMYTASRSSSSRDALTITIDVLPSGGGASRLARRSQSAAQRAENAQAAESAPIRPTISAKPGNKTSSTERSTERSASVVSIARSARSSSYASRARPACRCPRPAPHEREQPPRRSSAPPRAPRVAPQVRREGRPDAHQVSAGAGESRIAAPTILGCSAPRPAGTRLRSSSDDAWQKNTRFSAHPDWLRYRQPSPGPLDPIRQDTKPFTDGSRRRGFASPDLGQRIRRAPSLPCPGAEPATASVTTPGTSPCCRDRLADRR